MTATPESPIAGVAPPSDAATAAPAEAPAADAAPVVPEVARMPLDDAAGRRAVRQVFGTRPASRPLAAALGPDRTVLAAVLLRFAHEVLRSVTQADEGGETEVAATWRSLVDGGDGPSDRMEIVRAALQVAAARADAVGVAALGTLVDAAERAANARRFETTSRWLGWCRGIGDAEAGLLVLLAEPGEASTARDPDGTVEGRGRACLDGLCAAAQAARSIRVVGAECADHGRLLAPADLLPDPAPGGMPRDDDDEPVEPAPAAAPTSEVLLEALGGAEAEAWVRRCASFSVRLAPSVVQGWGVDHRLLADARRAVRGMTDATWQVLEEAGEPVRALPPSLRAVGAAIALRTRRFLEIVERWNHETALHPPAVGRLDDWSIARRVRRIARRPAAADSD